MAKRKATRSVRKAKPGRKSAQPRGSAKRPKTRRRTGAAGAKRAAGSKKRASRKARRTTRSRTATRATAAGARKTARLTAAAGTRKTARLNRPRRTLRETVQTPPSSLDMERHGSAARTGRAEMQQSRELHGAMTTAITGGDVDVNLEQAYFTGDEAPGGDNPTPDQDIVDEVGRALGVEYQDNEELRASDKVAERDKKRWELDPASSEDYKERK